jgi:hypothetical protein
MSKKELTEEEVYQKKMEANHKRRLANLEKSKVKRQAKVKELEETLVKVESGELQAPTIGQSKYLPNQEYKQTMTGNEVYASTIRNMMEFYLQSPVVSDDDLCERLAWFFSRCFETGQLITYEKMCLACGYTKSWVADITTGRKIGFSHNTAEILKKAQEFIASCDGELALQSKIQPVVYMFRAKNFYGMTDKQEMVVTPNNPLGEADVSTIEAKYNQLPDD